MEMIIKERSNIKLNINRFLLMRSASIIFDNNPNKAFTTKEITDLFRLTSGINKAYDTSILLPLKEIGYIDGWKEDGKWFWQKERLTFPETHKKRRYVEKSVRTEVFLRDGGKCVECGSQSNLEYDHIIAFTNGGSNSAKNIQLLCQKCNRSKSNKI